MAEYPCGCQRHAAPAAAADDRWEYRALRTRAEMTAVLDDLHDRLRAAGYPVPDRLAVRLALDEAITNAIVHGHGGDPTRLVLVRFLVADDLFVAQVEDEGPGFDPATLADPRHVECAGGLGIPLMRHHMTQVRYNARGNCVTLCKHRTQ
jgi:anti-sigma regulatory factor (Ser/Thr protein kinase)